MLTAASLGNAAKKLCEAIPDPLFIINSDLRVVVANPAAAAKFADHGPLEGQAGAKIFAGCSGFDLGDLCAEALCDHGPSSVTAKMPGKAGEPDIWYRFHVHILPDDVGQAAGFVVTVVDVTELVLMRQQQRQIQDKTVAIERMAVLSETTAAAAHELVQSLNAMQVLTDGILFWLRQGMMPEPDTLKEKLLIIGDQMTQSAEIIRQVRSFANGRSEPLKMIPSDLNDIVRGALNLAGAQLRSRGIATYQDLATGLPQIRADRVSLQQIVVSMLVNAMEGLSNIPTADREVFIRTFAVDQTVILEIADSGPGIPDSLLDSLFQPFVTGKAASANVGLGLSYCRSVIAAHEALLSVRNNDDRGATFQVSFDVLNGTGGDAA